MKKHNDDWDAGFRFFTGAIISLPFGIALWIIVWCVASKMGCCM